MLASFRTSTRLSQGPIRGSSVLQQLSRQGNLQLRNFQIRKSVSPQTAFRLRSQNRVSSPGLPSWRTSPIRRTRGLRYNSNNTKPSIPEYASTKSLSLSGRFKELSRRYGWAAVGVYFFLSALDFPFCFLAVRLLGTERIARAEHFVVENFWKAVGALGLDMRQKDVVAVPAASGTAAGVQAGEEMAEQTGVHAGHDNASMYKLQPELSGGHTDTDRAGIWTQLLLAYGVHKSLIFFRVPLTAAVTPKIVKWLRARGWNIGKTKAVVANTPK